MANKNSRDAWWRREINTWLDKLGSAQQFVSSYHGACASYEWKQMAIEIALVRWPRWKSRIKKLKGTC